MSSGARRAAAAIRGDRLALAAALLSWPLHTAGAPAAPVTGSPAHRSAESPAPATPEILARVDGDPVTRAEWERLLADRARRGPSSPEPADPSEESPGRRALRELIHRRLFLREAERRGVTVSLEELDATVTALRRSFDDLASFGVWMRERGLDDASLYDTVRDDARVARVRGALVEGLSVTDEQVRRYYESHPDELASDEVWLQVIAVRERALADEVQAALGRGEDFGKLARRHSLGRAASRGGDLGWIDAETLGPTLRHAVATLRPGEAIGPLPRGETFLVVRLHERRAGRTKTLAEARPEIRRRLLRSTQQRALERWLAAREAASTIELLDPLDADAPAALRPAGAVREVSAER